MLIFHKIIFMRIFHKRESLFMLPKGKCICMLKSKFCVASFRFLAILILFVFVFFSSFTPTTWHWKHLYLESAKNYIFFLKIRIKSSFSHPVFGRGGCRLSNLIAIFLPDDSFRDGKIRLKSQMFPFLLQNPQWSQRINSHEPCK